MKQVFQNLKNGELFFLDIPYPNLEKNRLIIKTSKTLISSGTEKYLIKFGKSNYFQKAINEPERLKQVLTKIKNDGLFATYEAVKSKLDLPFPMGYCNVGLIEKSDNLNFKVGDRVVSNSNHSEIVTASPNLTCKIPDNVNDEEACYAIPASIGLHGIRLINLSFGETIIVYGMGLLGLLVAQTLKNSGYKVCGVDNDAQRVKLTKSIDIECFESGDIDLEKKIINFNNGILADGAIITASSNEENFLNDISKILRERGKIVCVGTIPIKFDRSLIYKKEISFQVSASYGPGRYDDNYINGQFDYPSNIQRWTAKRNIEYGLELISSKKIKLDKIINSKYSFEKITDAYNELINSNPVSILLNYKENVSKKDEIVLDKIFPPKIQQNKNTNNGVGVIGAGNYCSRFILPQVQKDKFFSLKSLSSSQGISSSFFSKKFNIESSTTNNDKILRNDDIKYVFIVSPHNLHSSQIITALKNKKKIFVEKPLAINIDQLSNIKESYKELIKQGNENFLMMGYNRRYSILSEIAKKNLEHLGQPCAINYNINSGFIDNKSWIQDKDIGGGRVIGEICHFIDFIKFITKSKILSYDVKYISENKKISDNLMIQFKLSDNSIANINYFSNGSGSFPKENIDIYTSGIIMSIKNFKKIEIFGKSKFSGKTLFSQNKGNKECVHDFLYRVKNNKESPTEFEDLCDTSKITIDITNTILS